MDRIDLISNLNNYQTSFNEEVAYIPRFKSLLINFPNCFQRSLKSGHMTGSAWIVDQMGEEALLVHHRKLNRWLQPGGHADGDENIIAVARKEAIEETGLKSLKLRSNKIFDIDIHTIPKHKDTQAHFHFDVRFLFSADRSENHIVSKESNRLNWIPLNAIHQFTGNNPSIHRMVLKTKLIFNS